MAYRQNVARTIVAGVFSGVLVATLLAACITPAYSDEPQPDEPFNFEEASRDVPKPRELLPILKQDMVPADFTILSDEIVPAPPIRR